MIDSYFYAEQYHQQYLDQRAGIALHPTKLS